MQNLKTIFKNERIILGGILILALIHGLVYVFIMPPWQHYDEPNHFEYAWLLNNMDAAPTRQDNDPEMRRAVLRSMVEHDFYAGLDYLPDLGAEAPKLGVHTQVDELPYYYEFVSLPWRFLGTEDVTQQLYASRIMSLSFLLITVLAGWGMTAELTPKGHPLRYFVPLTLALLPGFIDVMAALNSDAAGIAALSLFFWAGVRVLRRDLSILNLTWLLLAAVFCLFTKRTVFVAVPLTGVVLLFAFFRGKLRIAAWGLLLAAGLLSLIAVFTWGDAALWYRGTDQSIPTRYVTDQAPDGAAAFRVRVEPDSSRSKLVQAIPPSDTEALKDQTVTLGAWIWASEPVEIDPPKVMFFQQKRPTLEQILVNETPKFYVFTYVPDDIHWRAWVELNPGKNLEITHPVEIYYDGVVLTPGVFPGDTQPNLDQDVWGGVQYENLLRNGSAERSWMNLRPWAETVATKVFSDYKGQEKFSLTVYSMIDLEATYWYYLDVGTNLFRTFWAKFGWGHVPLLGSKPYARILLPVSMLALAGAAFWFWRRRGRLSTLPWDVYFFLTISLALIWGMTLIRGTSYLFIRWSSFVVARYTYPAILPAALLFSAGWLSWFEWGEERLRTPTWLKYALYLGGFLLLSAYATAGILQYYQ